MKKRKTQAVGVEGALLGELLPGRPTKSTLSPADLSGLCPKATHRRSSFGSLIVAAQKMGFCLILLKFFSVKSVDFKAKPWFMTEEMAQGS